jgi:hypothetical protein
MKLPALNCLYFFDYHLRRARPAKVNAAALFRCIGFGQQQMFNLFPYCGGGGGGSFAFAITHS